MLTYIFSKGKFDIHEFVAGYEFVPIGYEFVSTGYEFVPTEFFFCIFLKYFFVENSTSYSRFGNWKNFLNKVILPWVIYVYLWMILNWVRIRGQWVRIRGQWVRIRIQWCVMAILMMFPNVIVLHREVWFNVSRDPERR